MAPFRRSESRGERSATDREAARLQRERQRAERAGEVQPEPPPEPPSERAEPAPSPDQQPADDQRPTESYDVEADQLLDEPAPREAEAPSELPAAEPTPAAEPFEHESPLAESAIAARRTIRLPRPQTTEQEGGHTDSWDRPVGTMRGSRGDYLPQPGATGIPPHRKLGVPRSRSRLRRVLPLALLVLIAIVIGVFAWLLFQPFHGEGAAATLVVRIPEGSGAREIGDLLAKEGVISSGFFFALRARLAGDRDKLRSGTYRLRRDMSYATVLDALTTPPRAAPVLKVTLPEGPSRRELAVRVKELGISGSYLVASKRSSRLDPRDYGAPRGATLEGFLFPATYEIRRSEATARRLVGEQLTAFKRNFAQLDLRRAKRGNLTRYDVLIIASMIEREASSAKDRRLISAVIYNRLQQRMPLGIDATIRYRLNNWSRPLRMSELATDSAFNTRKRMGLPPSPIGNPGLAALKAAADPARASYLFYVVKPCGNGDHAFSSTDTQFQRDVAAYQRARTDRGGKDPSRC